MAVKLDISKAYNQVEWLFLWNLMSKLGFDDTWIWLAMETVCTASYSILINGEPHGLVKPSRGIKQGNPLSPYLFLATLCWGLVHNALKGGSELVFYKGCILSAWSAHFTLALCRRQSIVRSSHDPRMPSVAQHLSLIWIGFWIGH